MSASRGWHATHCPFGAQMASPPGPITGLCTSKTRMKNKCNMSKNGSLLPRLRRLCSLVDQRREKAPCERARLEGFIQMRPYHAHQDMSPERPASHNAIMLSYRETGILVTPISKYGVGMRAAEHGSQAKRARRPASAPRFNRAERRSATSHRALEIQATDSSEWCPIF